MDLSVIIVNYNTLELTRSCIDSVRRQTRGIDYEIIVVDNDSRDGSPAFFAAEPDIVFVESGANIGFGRANNLGMERATGRYLLMLNSDTVLQNDVLSRVVALFDTLPEEVACVGTLLVHGDGKPSHSFGFYPDWRDDYRRHPKTPDTTSIVGDIQDVDYVSGADLFVRRSVADKLGLFDPDFFMYYEDTELGFRYRRAGFRCVIVNERGIVHLEGASTTDSYRRVSTISKSFFLYLRKTLSPGAFRWAKTRLVSRRIFTVWHYRWPLKDSFRYIKMLFRA